jgi:hypothetical protein
MSLPDERAISLILFQFLQLQLYQLEHLDEPMARSLIEKGLSLLPGLNIEQKEEEPDLIYLKFDSDSKAKEIPFSMRDAIDSLMVIWRDYSRLQNPS